MKDLLGHEVAEGDFIAAGVTLGQTANTRIGIVTEVIEKSQKLRVKWTHGPAIPTKPALLMGVRGYSKSSTFVIINEEVMDAARVV